MPGAVTRNDRSRSRLQRVPQNRFSIPWATELSLTFSTLEALEQVLDDMELPVLEIPKPASFLAGKAFAQYRRRGGVKNNVLADFFIGANAAVSGLPLLTRDTRRYAHYFPSVELVAPAKRK